MDINYDYMEKLAFTIQGSIYPLIDSLFENKHNSPLLHVDFAIYHYNHLIILRHTNGVEFSMFNEDLGCDHKDIIPLEKIKRLNQNIDEHNDSGRHQERDYIRVFDAFRLKLSETTENDYYLVFSLNNHYHHMNSLYAKEVLDIYTQLWNSYLIKYYDFPENIIEMKGMKDELSQDIIDEIKQTAIRNLLHEKTPQLSVDQMTIFSILDLLSNKTYERRVVAGSLIFSKSDTIVKGFKFKEPIPLNIQEVGTIRKILETTGKNSLIVYENRIIGMGNAAHYPLEVKFVGTGRWDCVINDSIAFYVKNGNLFIPSTNTAMDFVWKYNDEFPNSENTEYKLHEIIDEAVKQRHGTSIVISTEAQEEAIRLCAAGRGFLIEPIDLYKEKEMVEQITAIDGALFVDQNGICYAIGVIVDGEAVIKGDRSRGARYNTLVNYIAWKSLKRQKMFGDEKSDDKSIDEMRFLAVIISEDQSVDYFSIRDVDFSRHIISDVLKSLFDNIIN